MARVSAMESDYDSDPERWGAWRAPRDVHTVVAAELRGPILDVGCGDGRLAALLSDHVAYIGLDSSPTQLQNNPRCPVVLADMRHLPFGDGAFAEVTHLWCLYDLDDPVVAIREAWRVLRRGGRYYAATAARTSDPELIPGGYPPSTFDAEEAARLVATILEQVEPEYLGWKILSA